MFWRFVVVLAAAIVSFEALASRSFQQFESESESEFERALAARRNQALETVSICYSDCEQYDLRTSLAEATFGRLCSEPTPRSSINETRASSTDDCRLRVPTLWANA